MKVRLWGTEDECRQMAGLLEQVMTVQAVSDPYPDRGRSMLVRVYVEGIPRGDAASGPLSVACPACGAPAGERCTTAFGCRSRCEAARGEL